MTLSEVVMYDMEACRNQPQEIKVMKLKNTKSCSPSFFRLNVVNWQRTCVLKKNIVCN